MAIFPAIFETSVFTTQATICPADIMLRVNPQAPLAPTVKESAGPPKKRKRYPCDFPGCEKTFAANHCAKSKFSLSPLNPSLSPLNPSLYSAFIRSSSFLKSLIPQLAGHLKAIHYKIKDNVCKRCGPWVWAVAYPHGVGTQLPHSWSEATPTWRKLYEKEKKEKVTNLLWLKWTFLSLFSFSLFSFYPPSPCQCVLVSVAQFFSARLFYYWQGSDIATIVRLMYMFFSMYVVVHK